MSSGSQEVNYFSKVKIADRDDEDQKSGHGRQIINTPLITIPENEKPRPMPSLVYGMGPCEALKEDFSGLNKEKNLLAENSGPSLINKTDTMHTQHFLDNSGLDKSSLDKSGLDKSSLDKSSLDNLGLDKSALDKSGLGNFPK